MNNCNLQSERELLDIGIHLNEFLFNLDFIKPKHPWLIFFPCPDFIHFDNCSSWMITLSYCFNSRTILFDMSIFLLFMCWYCFPIFRINLSLLFDLFVFLLSFLCKIFNWSLSSKEMFWIMLQLVKFKWLFATQVCL